MPEAIERVVSGSHAAGIAVAYDQNQRDLYSYALTLTRNPAVAEDIVQESFLRLVTEAARTSLPDVPRAWLFTVCTNLIRSRARRTVVADRLRHPFGRDEQA